ncbi:DNA damage-regulated autophagy modulator protein 2 [Elysia marginata]|uniref:DNA damage-regulated autophagy modulator protein 2 n=1 Tax=Elysia marginata TaxID=1093978 RepID=A0AAV4HXS8_9GAST|nr:DNA damage-regulated autophagy modulator protein 2 [Elysia marginata]
MSCLGLLPIALVILTVSAFLLTYLWAVVRGDVSPGFPYISDTGAHRPESSIFSQLLNMSSFVAFFVMYIRYKAVQAIVRAVDGQESVWLGRMNKISAAFGFIASFGVCVVANFQEGTEVESVHFTGAALAFGPGVLYCFMQTALSYHMHPRFNGVLICRVRLLISMFCVVACVIMSISGAIAVNHWNASPHSSTKYKWKPSDPGFVPHIVSTVCEWLLSFGFFCFFLTYVREFNKFEMEVHTRALVTHLDLRPDGTLQITLDASGQSAGLEGRSNSGYQAGAGEPDERTKLLG